MDIFGAVATTVHEIHVAFVFIKRVVEDVRDYGSENADIRARLAHEILFFDDFKRLFFLDKQGRSFFEIQSEAIRADCRQSLDRLSYALAGYRVQALRHGLDLDLSSSEMLVTSGSSAVVNTSSKDSVKSFDQRFSAKLAELKLKAIHWSMFDKKDLKAMLETVRDWMLRLRETVAWMLSASQLELSSVKTGAIKGMGLEPMLKRQNVARNMQPDDSFGPLEGHLDTVPLLKDGLGTTNYTDSSSVSYEVVYEVRKYDSTMKHDRKLSESVLSHIRNLAWLLHTARFQDGIDRELPRHGGAMILGLDFKGYINMPDDEMIVFLYEEPEPPLSGTMKRGGIPRTLYDCINGSLSDLLQDCLKPSLDNRLRLAHTVALTVLNVHASLWVHKNIRSSSFAMYAMPDTAHPWRQARLLPFIVGWESARPDGVVSMMGADFGDVSNLYRHPQRQNQPTQHFRAKHDLYALGVVLIEIGMWTTVDKIFATEVAQKQLKPDTVVAWWSTTGRRRILENMGVTYQEAVDFCINLKTKPVSRDLELLNFRQNVIDVLSELQRQ